jgi:hypothetical protein
MFLPVVARWLRRPFPPSRRFRRPIHPLTRQRRLAVEVLEDRSLLSTVFNLSDHDPGSLRDAIATTPDGGTVDFQPGLQGTIFLTTDELLIAKNLTIQGPGRDVLTVSGNNAHRVFNIAPAVIVNVAGLTIANATCDTAPGGGIYTAGTLTVTDTTVRDNSGCSAGAILNDHGMLTIARSTLSGNTATLVGGVYNNGGTLTINSSILSGNSGGDGGGVANVFGTLSIMASTLSGNSGYLGGAIYNVGYTASITDSTLSGNNGIDEGGAIYNGNYRLAITNSLLSGNTGNFGSGIFNDGILTIITSTLSGNSGPEGCIYDNYYAGLTMTDSTISGNGGGGLTARIPFPGTLTLKNTIVAGNGPFDVRGPVDSRGHNLIGDGTGGSGFAGTDLVGTPAFPIDPQLEPLGNYGGPTPTMRPLPGSLALNAGDNTGAPDTDQRGFPRIVLGFIDIGAVELQPSEFGGPGGGGGASGSALLQSAADAGPVPPLAGALLPVSPTVPTDTTPRTDNTEAPTARPAPERDRVDAVFQTGSDRTYQPQEHRRSRAAVDGRSERRTIHTDLAGFFDPEAIGWLTKPEGGHS